MRVGDLAAALGVSQSTCSHHVELLSEVGFVVVDKVGTSSMVSVNAACCTGLPHAADVVMGTLSVAAVLPRGPARRRHHPRRSTEADMAAVLAIYAEGFATRNATFETERAHRRAAARQVAARASPGWPSSTARSSAGPRSPRSRRATATRASARPASTSPRPPAAAASARRCCSRQVIEADAGPVLDLQTSIFPENRASLALHHSAGYRTLAVRTRIAQLDGVWRDTVLLERRSESA